MSSQKQNMCQNIKLICLIILILIQSTFSLRCYFTNLIWAKDCSHVIEEKYSARPACLRAVIIDGKCFLNLQNSQFNYLISRIWLSNGDFKMCKSW